uniref:NAD dependent epimerase/dehydratase n=1 Tax=Pithovirus LCPAC101 TaxID=2506586 RepID=A0A481Z2D5_9VIRU|nr:MAG: NAD dependent epimerase/dehydratase [Pithovirus LCPAC101]
MQFAIVTGSSGFIGSALSNYLLSKNMVVFGVDKEDTKISHKYYFHLSLDVSMHENMIKLESKVIDIIDKYNILKENIFVCHLAAKISVKDSMTNLYDYYNNNTVSTLNILEFMHKNNLNNIYFSSTAAVYNSNYISNNKLLLEEGPLKSESVYGNTKKLAEDIILDYGKQFNITGYIFRFFNVAGGRDTLYPPHHLIPILIDSFNKNKSWKIYGSDYPTKDGSCVRDYVHVNDIANAFYLAMQKRNNIVDTINLGSGCGYSVRKIMDMTSSILTSSINENNNNNINIYEYKRRPGDPPFLVADINKAKNVLNWSPEYSIQVTIKDTITSYNTK